MNNWRPEGWENPYTEKARHWPRLGMSKVKIAHDAYECGADKLLKALIEKGALMTPEQMKLLAPLRKFPYGHIVFVPEDKENQGSTGDSDRHENTLTVEQALEMRNKLIEEAKLRASKIFPGDPNMLDKSG